MDNNGGKNQTNTLAIVGFILSFFVAIAGLIVSIIGLKKSKEINSGKGLSIAGIVISSISMLFSIFIIIFVAILMVNYSINVNDAAGNINNSFNDIYDNVIENERIVDTYYAGDTFTFDGFEITVGSNYEFVLVNNETSPYNNHTAVKLPVTIKNISDESNSLNEYYYEVHGSNDEEVVNLGVYFLDDAIDYGGMLSNGESYTKYMYFQYVGNGKYEIEFDNYIEELEVEFNIVKN